jgi:hypothetical protein
MARKGQDGDEYTSANGYRYRRVEGRYRLVHHIIAEESLGRKLRADEGAYFKDGDRSNLDPSNIGVRVKGSGKDRTRLVAVEDRIRELVVERSEFLARLGLEDHENELESLLKP